VKAKLPAPTKPAHKSRGTHVTARRSTVRVLGNGLDHLATAAVAIRKQVAEATPSTNNECVSEKQRIAEAISTARAKKDEAESQKKLAETSEASLNAQISLLNDQKAKLNGASDGFSSKWMPLMTMIGSNEFVTEINAARAKVDEVEADVNSYRGLAGAPTAAAGLPTALNTIRETIAKLRDGVQADLSTLQSTFTGTLMTAYPASISELDKKVEECNKEKAAAAQTAASASAEVNTQSSKISQLDAEWDSVHATCEKLLKSA
jgi:predicted nuclease with TOPRIM domain